MACTELVDLVTLTTTVASSCVIRHYGSLKVHVCVQRRAVNCVDEIQWYELCENHPDTKEQTVQCFGELANAFRLLYQFSSQWTDDAVISVIDEMICKCSLLLLYMPRFMVASE